MITRIDAIRKLDELINSAILSPEYEEDLQTIINCISAEEDGMHVWGAPDEDVVALYTSYNESEMTDELQKDLDKKYQRYAFGASEFEQEQLDMDIEEELELDNEADDSGKQG